MPAAGPCLALLLSLCACDANATLGRWAGDATTPAMDPPDAGEPDMTAAPAAGADPLTEADYIRCDELGGGPGCGFCLGDACCSQILRCVEDDGCACWLDCTRDRPLSECDTACGAPPTASWQAVRSCSDQLCDNRCPPLG